jgi:hypothetical protein
VILALAAAVTLAGPQSAQADDTTITIDIKTGTVTPSNPIVNLVKATWSRSRSPQSRRLGTPKDATGKPKDEAKFFPKPSRQEPRRTDPTLSKQEEIMPPIPGIGGVNPRELTWILTAGAAGGFLSWVYAFAFGQPLPLHGGFAVPACVALGIGAAFIGVYVIANTDTSAFLRAAGFALLCGFSWKPIYDAGSALITQHTNERQAQTSAAVCAKRLDELQHAPAAEVTAKVTEATTSAVTAIQAARTTDNPQVKELVLRNTDALIAHLTSIDGRTTDPQQARAASQVLIRERVALQ